MVRGLLYGSVTMTKQTEPKRPLILVPVLPRATKAVRTSVKAGRRDITPCI
jgi:hypothetical protein